MHFGTIEVSVATVRPANPIWLTAAVSCQLATYVCAAVVWFRVLERAGSPLPFLSLLRLAVVELFANQAIPTGGLSGSVMVVRGLTRRGVAPAIAVTALLIAALSYYAAYFLVVLLAFVLLWNSGDLILHAYPLAAHAPGSGDDTPGSHEAHEDREHCPGELGTSPAENRP